MLKLKSLSIRSNAVVHITLLCLISALLVTSAIAVQSRRAAPEGYISGVVRSSQGPEAGVWVIAETRDLLTNFIKTVVTDDQGRFMIPELPDAILQNPQRDK